MEQTEPWNGGVQKAMVEEMTIPEAIAAHRIKLVEPLQKRQSGSQFVILQTASCLTRPLIWHEATISSAENKELVTEKKLPKS